MTRSFSRTSIHYYCDFCADLFLVKTVKTFPEKYKKNRSRKTSQKVRNKRLKNRAGENRKTRNKPKKVPKPSYRNLKLKSHEEYLIYRKYFVQ